MSTETTLPATMKAVVMNAPGDVVVETVETPRVEKPTDVVLKLAAACVCGSDLWPYRGHNEVDHRQMGHEYVGTIVEKGEDVATLELGDFVIGSFMLSDNTCEICLAGGRPHTPGGTRHPRCAGCPVGGRSAACAPPPSIPATPPSWTTIPPTGSTSGPGTPRMSNGA